MGTLPTLDLLEMLPNYDSCDKGSPSDEMWEKFGFGSLTPPHSPDQDSNIANSLCGPLSSRPSTPQELDKFCKIFPDVPKTLPDLKDTCFEIFEQEQKQLSDCSNKLRKDCMWNGNKDTQPMTVHRRGRSDSPASLSCSPASSGCIDPQALFNFNQISDRIKPCTNNRRLYPDSGPETPCDSEEEVDVVTVEKRSPMKHISCSNYASIRTKYFGSIVQANKLGSPLAVISADRNQPAKTGHTISNTPRKVSMLITNGDHCNGKKTFHLKCVPVLNTANVINNTAAKRKLIMSENSPTAVLQVMKIAPTNASVMTEKIASVSAEKRRILSLEGVSMVSDTGIKRNTTKKNCRHTKPLKENLDKVNFQLNKDKNIHSSLPTMKKLKKHAKRQVSSDDDSSGSCTSESPNHTSLSSSKKQCLSSRSTSSSGSDEDSIRNAHNVLERQRRQGLRDLYLKLRLVVPEVANVERAPKVNILKKAKEHVLELHKISKDLKGEKSALQQRKRILQQRLHKMAEEFSVVGDRHHRKNFGLF